MIKTNLKASLFCVVIFSLSGCATTGSAPPEWGEFVQKMRRILADVAAEIPGCEPEDVQSLADSAYKETADGDPIWEISCKGNNYACVVGQDGEIKKCDPLESG